MQVLSYGYEQPENGDLAVNASGTGWYAQWVYNIARLNSHNHDGTNSPLLTTANISGNTVIAPSGSWASGAWTGYKQSVTVPAAINDVNNYIIKFFISTIGARFGTPLSLTYVRTGTGTTFDLYCNDNTIDVTCLFR